MEKQIKEEPEAQVNQTKKKEVSKSPLHNGGSPPPRGEPFKELVIVDCPTPEEGQSLARVRKLLSTLMHLRTEPAEVGDRMRQMVLALLAGTTTLETFETSVQELISCPLKPFVVPLLKAHLPSLQRELGAQAVATKQSLAEFLSSQDPLDGGERSVGGIEHLFTIDLAHSSKRRYAESLYEDELLPPKRPFLHSHPPEFMSGGYQTPGYPGPLRNPKPEDHWKNIHVMLNCILSMVEKTKRALGVLQHSGRSEDEGRTAGDLMAHTIRITEDRVAQVRRRAEEAVAEVKRQAVADLQRAVAAAELRATQLVTAEKAKLDKMAMRRADDPPAPDPINNCWNCGRKAVETCSGCNSAKYCGPFCQHKDWEAQHHALCSPPAKPALPSLIADRQK